MPQTPTQILVFKTNLKTKKRINAVRPFLNVHPGIERWNVDVQDDDKVLRIVPQQSLNASTVIALLRDAGFDCEELPD